VTKTKAQLRAEAVERLKNLKDGMFCYTDAAAVVGINGYVNANMFRDALIDLLTDDECDQPCYTCSRLAELLNEVGMLRARVKELENDEQYS